MSKQNRLTRVRWVGTRNSILLLGLAVLFVAIPFLVRGGSNENVFGYASIDGYGYLSMNCFNTDAADGSGTRTDNCSVPFGVSITWNRKFTGLSWGPNIGWVCWGQACNGQQFPGMSAPLSGYSATVTSDGKVDGTGYVAAFAVGGDVDLSGTASDAAQTPFGVFVNIGDAPTSNTGGRCKNEDNSDMTVSPGEFCGAAYNDILGWIRLRGLAADGTAYLMRSSFRSDFAPTVTQLVPTTTTKTITVTPTFSWATVDPEGDAQASAELVICKTATNADCENDTTSGARVVRGVIDGSAQSCTYPCGIAGAPATLDLSTQFNWKIRATDGGHALSSQPFVSAASARFTTPNNSVTNFWVKTSASFGSNLPPSIFPSTPINSAPNVDVNQPVFSWSYQDPEGDPQTEREIVVCRTAIDPNCERAGAAAGSVLLRARVAVGASQCVFPCNAVGAPSRLGFNTQFNWKIRATDANHLLDDQPFVSEPGGSAPPCPPPPGSCDRNAGFTTIPHRLPIAEFQSVTRSSGLLPGTALRFASTSQCFRFDSAASDASTACTETRWVMCTKPNTALSLCESADQTIVTGDTFSTTATSCGRNVSTCSFAMRLIVKDDRVERQTDGTISVGRRVVPKIRRITPF